MGRSAVSPAGQSSSDPNLLFAPNLSDNFTGIDWLHDAIKDSIRRRKLQYRKQTQGLRGQLAVAWDKAQGWILVSLIGFVTACLAFGIINLEMWAFDLKEGYCAGRFFTAKRFCCVADATRLSAVGFLGWPKPAALPHAPTSSTLLLVDHACHRWNTWGQLWESRTGAGGANADWIVEHATFLALALLFSFLSCVMTIYLTSSASVFSSKDSPAMPYAGEFSPDFLAAASANSTIQSTLPELATQYGTSAGGDRSFDRPKVEDGKLTIPHARPRKVTYHAAGSGIPQIKVS